VSIGSLLREQNKSQLGARKKKPSFLFTEIFNTFIYLLRTEIIKQQREKGEVWLLLFLSLFICKKKKKKKKKKVRIGLLVIFNTLLFTSFFNFSLQVIMSYQQYAMLPQTEESLSHILSHYEKFKQEKRGQAMVVGVSGCQGSGKTTLCDTLVHLLKEPPHQLRVASFSLDDVYLTREEQVALADKYAGNPLYQQRGQAGSHDLTLANQTLSALLKANDQPVPIPAYDKSLHSGKGDRVDMSKWKAPVGPFDIILFEGWMVGFKPVMDANLYQTNGLSLDQIRVLNDQLKPYESEVYPFFDIFIHLSPNKLEQVYQWRLQQEHHMKATRGVSGLSDDDVRLFVDTYMPAYQLYLPRLDKVGFFGQGQHGETLKPYEGPKRADGHYSQSARHLRIGLNQDRHVTKVEYIEATTHQAKADKDNSKNKAVIGYNASRTTRVLISCAVVGVVGLFGFTRRRRIMDIMTQIGRRFTRMG
jgi:D-glycerate 3-kinase